VILLAKSLSDEASQINVDLSRQNRPIRATLQVHRPSWLRSLAVKRSVGTVAELFWQLPGERVMAVCWSEAG
jgi:hypothetical protein